MSSRDPRGDGELGRILREASGGLSDVVSSVRLRQLSERIVSAAAPMLDERAGRRPTVWDYTERWSRMLLPLGVLTSLAAGLCLFMLSSQREPASPKLARSRIALIGAATNRVSSQTLIDFLTTSDPVVAGGRSAR